MLKLVLRLVMQHEISILHLRNSLPEAHQMPGELGKVCIEGTLQAWI